MRCDVFLIHFATINLVNQLLNHQQIIIKVYLFLEYLSSISHFFYSFSTCHGNLTVYPRF